MSFSKEEMKNALHRWFEAWNSHDLDVVMRLFHDDVLFENWTGARVRGREKLRKAWASWFENHGNFNFTTEDLFIDEDARKALYRWRLDWPSPEKGREGEPETRRGVDVIHFRDGKIVEKLTYCKTTLEIGGERVSPSGWTGRKKTGSKPGSR